MPFVLDLTLTYAIIYLGRDNVLLSMILCFHQRKLQVESCKCSGSFFGQSIYNFSALSALTSKKGNRRACKMWKIDGWNYSEFSSLMQYWSRSQTWDTWRLEPRWEGGGDTVMWWPDNDNTMSCVMCQPHPLWRQKLMFRRKEWYKLMAPSWAQGVTSFSLSATETESNTLTFIFCFIQVCTEF